MAEGESDLGLLERCRNGDETAFLGIYRKLHPPIYRFALNMTGSPATAEDITQEVFLAVIREEFGYQPERGSLSAYLFGIARKLVLRHLDRHHAAGQEANGEAIRPELLAGPDPVVELLRREDLDALRRAVVSLPRRYREVVVLCDLQEIDYVDAAALLGCPVGTVRSRLHRARALLLDKLQPKRESGSRSRSLYPARSLI
jgi:RNA polymerase sigma-70 factor, ECF subfamily